jgi:hypothetical protein
MAHPSVRLMRTQRGQVMAFIAVAVAIVLMPLAAYAVDIATVSSAGSTLQAATAIAAMEAAQQLNTSAFRSSGVLVIDMSAARSAARAVLAAEAPSASVNSVSVSGVEVTIEAGQVVRLPFDFFPMRAARLKAIASARLAAGYDSPSSFLLKVSASDSSGTR